MAETRTMRAAAAKERPRGAIRTTVEPSAEMLGVLEADPTADIMPALGAPAGENVKSVRAFDVRTEETEHHGCPHCGADFSVTTPEHSSSETRDVCVRCQTCAREVLVPVAEDVALEDVEVGPPWDVLPARRIRDRVRELMAEHRDLSVVHAERIARLEDELAKAQLEARTDLVTGLLNERAHKTDSHGKSMAHGVLYVPTVALVYDRCGQESGNRIAHDAARLLRGAVKERARLYRLGGAKFALIGTAEGVQAALADVRVALEESSTTVSMGGEGAPRDAGSVEEYLDSHPKPYGLEVRMRPGKRA